MWLVRRRDPTPDGALSACLAALLEVSWAETPAAETGAVPLARWQEWLAARNLRAIEPAALPAAGFWIAAVTRDDARHHVVMFGAPPDVVWDPADDGAPVGPARAALVLAALDPVLPTGRLPHYGRSPRRPTPARRRRRPAAAAGTVDGLFIAPEPRRRAGRSTPPTRSPGAGCAATGTSRAPGPSVRRERSGTSSR